MRKRHVQVMQRVTRQLLADQGRLLGILESLEKRLGKLEEAVAMKALEEAAVGKAPQQLHVGMGQQLMPPGQILPFPQQTYIGTTIAPYPGTLQRGSSSVGDGLANPFPFTPYLTPPHDDTK